MICNVALAGNGNPAYITAAYEQQAEAVIELQLEKAGVRLAYLLDNNLKVSVTGQKGGSALVTAPSHGNHDVRVWVNTKSGVYHCPGTRWFGNTRAGEYMTQKEAQSEGYHAANGEPCE